MTVAVFVLLGSLADADAKPFRPFVDRIGVTANGAIVTTTNASGQSDPPNLGRHQLTIFGADGTMVSSFDVEQVQHVATDDRGYQFHRDHR